MLNICWIKNNETMNFGQLIEHNKGNIFFQKSCRTWGRETSSRHIFAFLKSFIWSKSKWSSACFHFISIAFKLAYNKNKLNKTLGYWSSVSYKTCNQPKPATTSQNHPQQPKLPKTNKRHPLSKLTPNRKPQ